MLKLGIIGTGWITEHFISAAEENNFKLTSIYSRSMERGEDFSKKYSRKIEVFDDYDQFLAEGNFDVLYIASPNNFHYGYAKKALLAKKDTIVEKPIVITPKEFLDLKQIALKKGVYLFEAIRHLHTQPFRLIKKEIKNLKQLQGATLTFMKYSSRYDDALDKNKVTPNVFRPEFAGGALEDLGIYLVYSAVEWFGKPKRVKYYPTVLETGVDGKGVALFEYEDFLVTLIFGKTTNSYMDSEIYGLKETIVMDSAVELGKVFLIDETGKHLLDVEQNKNELFEEAKFFKRLLEDKSDNSRKEMLAWLNKAQVANELIYKMRKDSGLNFPMDDN